jgi:2'-5' RNA ligase
MDKRETTAAPLILTLKLDAESFAFFDALRRKHFPAERNFLSAHVTLFHNLPGSWREQIETDLNDLCRHYKTFPLRFPRWRFLGRGSAIEIESAELNSLRDELKNKWNEWLTAQDRQKFKPHITVQNKVSPDAARSLFDELSADWSVRNGAGVGIELWLYLNGPWKLAGEFAFE